MPKPIPQPRREVRFPGISHHSVSLGVTREHLWQVLTGRRTSRSLLQRYRTLLQKEGRRVPTNLSQAA